MWELKDRIKFIRKLHGLSQKDFAKLIAVTPLAVSNWETGTRRPSTICVVNIAKHLVVQSIF